MPRWATYARLGVVVPSLDVPPISQDMADAILRRDLPRYMADALKGQPHPCRSPEQTGGHHLVRLQPRGL